MSLDAALKWNPNTLQFDIAMDGADLEKDNGLITSIILSLFTWRRADEDDQLDDEDDRKGFWGDSFNEEGDKTGSKLWLLRRQKLTTETINRAETYIREALQWMTEDGVASRVDVQLFVTGRERLDILLNIYRNTGISRSVRFDDVWGAIKKAA